jgi:hypothetical protein
MPFLPSSAHCCCHVFLFLFVFFFLRSSVCVLPSPLHGDSALGATYRRPVASAPWYCIALPFFFKTTPRPEAGERSGFEK